MTSARQHHGRHSKSQQQQSAPAQDLLAFGYACRLFRDDELAARLETGRHLLPWGHSGDSTHNAPLMIDRYDVRNLLDSLTDFDQTAHEDDLAGITAAETVCDYDIDDSGDDLAADTEWKQALDAERFHDVDPDEEAFQAMDEAEQAAFLEDKRQGSARTEDGFNAQRWEYINAPAPPPDEEVTDLAPPPNPFVLKYPAPPGIAPPHSERLAAIIEKTAKFINASGNAQMEFLVKAKQSGNPDFRFLDADSVLQPYYKHVRKLVGTALGGLDAYGSDSDSENGSGEEDETGAQASAAKGEEATEEVPNEGSAEGVEPPPPALQTGVPGAPELLPQLWLPPPPLPLAPLLPQPIDDPTSQSPPADLRAVIDKLALFVARNGADFESKVKAKNRDDPRFSFLLPWNKWHAYYSQVRDDHLNDPMLNRDPAQVAAEEEAERNAKRARAKAALEKVRAAAGGGGGSMESKRRKLDQKP
ncbi:hypothetical protein HDU89_000387 [Geranomyces variabilis]|nr:hypothetical protein HDU89_000387 [Geranomyces variabilis]